MPNTASSFSTYTTLMRVTPEGRPYCQDMYDLFAALMIQHGLRDHRYRFRTIPASLVYSEAIEILGNLQFTHTMRTPDPADPTRLIATKTTTTFSMSPNMAMVLGQHFVTSRLIENAVDPTSRTIKERTIFVLTPKGKYAIQDFSQRAQVSIQAMQERLAKIDSFPIVVLERLPDHHDKLAFARPNMTLAFKTLMAYLPMESLLADDAGGIEKANLDDYKYAFFGSQAFEWISEYTTVVTREEAEMVAAEFVLYGWISQVYDKSDRENSMRDESVIFKMGRNTMYYVTARGRQVLGWDKPLNTGVALSNEESILLKQKALATRLKYGDAQLVHRHIPVTSNSKKSTTSSSASTTSSSSTSSSTQQTSSPELTHPNPFGSGGDHLEFSIPTGSGGNAPAAAAANGDDGDAVQKRNDLDEVTERLLQLRSPTTEESKQRRRSDSEASTPSRPSSIILSSNSSTHEATDFITSAPLDSSGQLDPNSHWAKLRQILEDPLIRMYFRDFMKSQFCEENVNIWVDYYNLRKKCKKGQTSTRELLADAYAIYDTYLAPGAPSEVNIDHALRQEIVAYVATTFTVWSGGDDIRPTAATAGNIPFVTKAFHQQHQTTVVVNGHTNQCLRVMMKLYDRVNEHICRIMAQDSVPKFIKTQKYKDLMSNQSNSSPPPPLMRRDSTSQSQLSAN